MPGLSPQVAVSRSCRAWPQDKRARPQVGVDSLAADFEFSGERRFLFAGGGALTQLLRLLIGERGFTAGVDAAGLGRGDALALALQGQGTLELGKGPRTPRPPWNRLPPNRIRRRHLFSL